MPQLTLRFLGPPHIELDGQPISLGRHKATALLAFLSLDKRQHTRDALATMFWPEFDQSRARARLRRTLSVINSALGSDWLDVDRDTVSWSGDGSAWIDVAVLRAHLADCDDHEHPADELCPKCVPLLTDAIELYHDGFLAGFTLPDAPTFDEWQFFETESLHTALSNAFARLVHWHETRQEYNEAIPHARRWLALDPTDETAQRTLMALYAHDGQHSAALRQYTECERVLAQELGVPPSAETTQLYQAIQEKRALPVPPLDKDAEHAPAPGDSPFKGLDFFDTSDAGLFFGRESLTEQLVQRLDRGERFLAIVGASGSGKSSLARAGLLAALAERDDYCSHVVTPTAHPLETLAVALTHETASVSETTTLIDDLARDPRSLHLYLRKRQQSHPDQNTLLLVDQFEELFTLCRDESEQQAFVANLLTAATEPTGQAIVVVTLRADFYHHCAQFGGLRQALEQDQAYIGAMSAKELRCAIEQPAAQGNWTFEPGLVDLLLRDVGADGLHPPEPGSLPLLSHALLETWKRRRDRTMTLEGYAEVGGVRGAIARTAESVYHELDEDQQDIARYAFLRLTELGQGTQDTRRRARLDELVSEQQDPGATQAVFQVLAGARLITTGQDSVQVTHEALIREWPRLREWLDESRDDLRFQRQLSEAAQEWRRAGKDASFLLRGTRLAQFEDWAAESSVDLTRDERTYLQASLEEQKRLEEEAKKAQLRKLEQARALAEAERQRAETEARAAKGLRRRATYVTVALLVALVAAIAAGVLGNQARTQADENALLAVQNRDVANTAQVDRAAALAGEATAQAAGTRIVIELGNAQTAEALEASQRATAQAAQITAVAAGEQEAQQRATAEVARDEAQEQARRALANQLSAQAPTLLDDELDLALLLAVQAYNTYDLPQSRGALLEVIEAYPGLLRILSGHQTDVHSVAFSPDGRWLASADLANTVQLRCTGGDWPLERTIHHEVDPDGIWHTIKPIIHDVMSFSPDSTLLALGDWTDWDNPLVWLHDVATGEPLPALTGHKSRMRTVAFSPDGTILASASMDWYGSLVLWDTHTGTPSTPSLAEYSVDIEVLAFQPDGQALVTAFCLQRDEVNGRCYQSETHLWDVGELLAVDSSQSLTVTASINQPLPGFAAGVASVAFSPDGTLLAMTGCNERQPDSLCLERGIILYDMALGAVTHEVTMGPEYQYPDQSVVFSPDGTVLVTHGRTGEMIAFWDVETLGPIRSIPAFDSAKSIAFDPTGTQLAMGAEDGNVYLWDTSAVLHSHETGNGGSSSYFATYDRTANSSSLTSAAFSPDGTILATGGFDGGVGLWEVATGQPLRAPLTFTGTVPFTWGGTTMWDVSFSPDGKILAAASWDGTVRLWDTDTWELIAEPFEHSFPANTVAWSADSKTLFSSDFDGPIYRWDLATGEPTGGMIARAPNQTQGIALSPDDKILASGCRNAAIQLWDAATGEQIGDPLTGHSLGISDVAFSPDGRLLASGSHDGTIRLWSPAPSSAGDAETWQPSGGPLARHQASIWAVVFSPDGKTLISTDADGMLRYWDLGTRRPIGPPIQAHVAAMDAVFSPDGTVLATVGSDLGGVGHIRFWDPNPLSWRNRICAMVGRNLTQSEWERYLPGLPYEKTCAQWPAGE